MSDKYQLRWDPERPVLHEVIGGDHWTDEDHQAYLVDLRELLKTAAADGFDVLSDSRDERIQESGSSDHESYTMLADAGARRCVQVVSPAVLAMQTGRMVRESGAGDRLAVMWFTTMGEAEQALR
jgi:hypothetical protein